MSILKLKECEIAANDKDSYVIKNPRTLEYQIISEYELHLLEILIREKDVTALLFPAAGWASASHLKASISLIKKLNRMGLLRESGRGGETTSFTNTDDIRTSSAENFCGVFLSTFARAFSFLPSNFLLILLIFLSGAVAFFFPIDQMISLQVDRVPYLATLLVWYFVATLAFSFRTILKTAFLRADKREIPYMGYRMFGPVFALDIRSKDVCMGGIGNRIAYGLVGLLAPIFLVAAFLGLYHLQFISLYYTQVASAACFLTILVLACPFLRLDGDIVLSGLFFPKSIDFTFAEAIQKMIRDRNKAMDRRLVFGVIASLIWLFAWYDFLYIAVQPLFASILQAFVQSVPLLSKISAVALALFVGLIFLVPVAYLAFLFSLRYRDKLDQQSILHFQGDTLTDDQIQERLNKIPLFAALDEATLKGLSKKLDVRVYQHGEYLVRQGDVGSEFFIILKGHVKAVYQDATGQDHDVGSLHEGDAFGEIALIDDIPRTASIMAVYGCQVLCLQKEVFDHNIVEVVGNPDQVKQMVRLMHFFKRHPVLSRLSAKGQAELIGDIFFKSFGSNQPVVEEGDSDHNFYVVYSGKLDVESSDESEKAVLQPEDYFGYLKVSPSVRTKTEGAGVLEIKYEDFEKRVLQVLRDKQEYLVQ